MNIYFFVSVVCASLCLSGVNCYANEDGLDLKLYGSWRLHTNATFVDAATPGQSTGYLGLSDAYSRVGAKASFTASGTVFAATLELGVNSADFKLGDPAFFDDEDLRVKSFSASGDWGSLVVGKGWLPYYNNVGYPVDYFSSIYAGYSTYAFFRENQLTYITPQINGFKGSLSRIKRTSGGPKGWHYTASYARGGLTLAVGMEDMENNVADTYGTAVSLKRGHWYGAIKYEHNDVAGDIYNAFAQYTHGKFIYKAGIGLGDQYAGNSYHLGADYKVNQDFKLFAEIYSEQNNYAILADGATRASDYLGAGGFGARQNGKAMVVGFRFDFEASPF